MKATALIDDKPYTVLCAGVRLRARDSNEARAIANNLIAEWSALGYSRAVRIFYRDGTEVAP